MWHGAHNFYGFPVYGEVATKLKKAGKAGPRENGTWVRAWPDPKYFDHPKVKRAELEAVLRAKAVLLPGLEVSLRDEASKDERKWKYEGGLSAYLHERLTGTGDRHRDLLQAVVLRAMTDHRPHSLR